MSGDVVDQVAALSWWTWVAATIVIVAGLVLAFRFLRSLMSRLIGLAGSVLLGVTVRELLMTAFSG